MFGICPLLFIVISFSFLEPNAIFIDLSVFTVMTAGLTKPSTVFQLPFPNSLFLPIVLILWLLVPVSVLVSVDLFVVLFVLLLSDLYIPISL